MNSKLFLVIYLCVYGMLSWAQDGYFSQFDKSRQLFNPAYTSFKRDFGADLLVRTQWGNTDGNSLKSFGFVDGKLKSIKSYVGFDVYHFKLFEVVQLQLIRPLLDLQRPLGALRALVGLRAQLAARRRRQRGFRAREEGRND